MFSLASGIQELRHGGSRLAIAGITAILLGLPSVAGATFFHWPDTSWGGSAAGGSPPAHDFSLSFRDFHAEIVERAAHDFDLPRPPELAEGFERARFRRTHRDGAPFDGLAKFPWIDEAHRRGPHWIAAALAGRHFCRLDPPPEVPEPGTALLLAGGLIGLSFVGRKRRA